MSGVFIRRSACRASLRLPVLRFSSARHFISAPVLRKSHTETLENSAPLQQFSNRRLWYTAGATSMIGCWWISRGSDDEVEDPKDANALAKVPLRKLVSGWIAFAFCSSPTWIDMSETMYSVVSKIPVVSYLSHKFIMNTFFNQFLGGEIAQECVPKIEALREAQMGTLLGYNIEAELDGSSKDPELIQRQIGHVLESIAVQGELGKKFCPPNSTASSNLDNRSWVRIKVTGLLAHPIALYNGSQAILRSRAGKGLDKDVPYPGLPHDGDWEAALSGDEVRDEDRQQLTQLRLVLETIASKARENNVRIVIDAEQSWYQPVIDALTDELMQEYNKIDGGPPVCIASFQAYLRRYPQLLEHQIQRADEKGYTLLFKQVRGAYMVTEAQEWKKAGRQGPGPVWATKAETDASYNRAMEKTIATIADQVCQTGRSRISALFATHNSMSIDHGIKLLEQYDLGHRVKGDNRLHVSSEAASSLCFGQLYGMKDDLTNRVTASLTVEGNQPLAIKSMSYGDLKECLPFLSRRAIENKSILEGRGGARAERVRLGREIRRRFGLA